MSSKTFSDDNDEATRKGLRAGTWRFISGICLQNPSRKHGIFDDLESFHHVLIHHLLRYRSTKFRKFAYNLDMLFDSQAPPDTSIATYTGGEGKSAYFRCDFYPDEDWRLALAKPCADIVNAYRSMFAYVYLPDNLRSPFHEKREGDAIAALQSGDNILAIFNEHLNSPDSEWPADDCSCSIRVLVPPWADAIPTKCTVGYTSHEDFSSRGFVMSMATE
ncbi:hypothetical protein BV25DRAFT_1914218 [Artomyces pyxidatus]|uniref:Uncharacterized protein n=1 Tax=Artomyces pyxidatus TaxID=48021 RepID=A0ACB8T936_9AGAM|nr:hypothetical protein BV25DRAFT_1914218 [Artomyces pyxidatus]